MKKMDYIKIIYEVKSLQKWKKIILEVRGPHPTEDSEFFLTKMLSDIIRINEHMIFFQDYMFNMIYCINIHEINV